MKRPILTTVVGSLGAYPAVPSCHTQGHTPAKPSIALARPKQRLLPGEGEGLVRRTLEDMTLLRERDPDHHEGVSQAELAADLGVSPQRVQAILSADQPAVNLRAGQILALRPRARRTLLALLNAASDELDTAGVRRAPESRARQLTALLGKLSEELDEPGEPGESARGCANDCGRGRSREKRAALRALFSAIAAAATAGVTDLED